MIKATKNNDLNNQNNNVDHKKVDIQKEQAKKQFTAQVNNIKPKNSSSGINDTFFEKFDKTKKDHKEKIRELKNKKTYGILTSFDKKLQSNRYVLKIYGIIALLSSIIVTLGVLLFVLLIDFFNGTPEQIPTAIPIAKDFYKFLMDSQYAVKLEVYQPLLQTTVIFSMLGASLMFTPIVYMVSSWFVGVNNIHKEKKFVIAYYSIIAIGGFLLFASLCFLFGLAWGPFGPFVYQSQ